MRNTDLTTNKQRDRRLKDEEHGPQLKQAKRQKIESEEHGPQLKQAKRQEIER
jgi:hypothetical protein